MHRTLEERPGLVYSRRDGIRDMEISRKNKCPLGWKTLMVQQYCKSSSWCETRQFPILCYDVLMLVVALGLPCPVTCPAFFSFQGMIASHDFERKVKDVKKYLDRGDIVRVRIFTYCFPNGFRWCDGTVLDVQADGNRRLRVASDNNMYNNSMYDITWEESWAGRSFLGVEQRRATSVFTKQSVVVDALLRISLESKELPWLHCIVDLTFTSLRWRLSVVWCGVVWLSFHASGLPHVSCAHRACISCFRRVSLLSTFDRSCSRWSWKPTHRCSSGQGTA